jgi:hypothetical protein
VRVSNKRGTPSIEGGLDLADEKTFLEFQVLGFPCRCLNTILGRFQRHFSGGFICIESGTISQEEGTPLFGG